ncbi:MAG: flippase-like domain-containing protein [Deltaproteobacteria bacterium]|nr:flippase-like domain-containing protein [Deltaproteobacteria bacterium]
MSPRFKRILKWAFLAVGTAVVVYLVNEVGPARVLETLLAAGPYMVLLVLFDFGWFSTEIAAHRILLEEDAKKIPWPEFVRAQMVTYVFMVLVPAGRAGAEIARATAFNPYVGAGRAAAAATNAQALSLLANSLITIPCLIAIGSICGWDHALTWLMALNGFVTFVGGTVILALSRKLRIGRFLGKRIRKMVHVADDLDGALRVPRSRLIKAVAVLFVGRISQTIQYGIALLAVGGLFTGGGALLAQGVHLVGAFAGDFIPNQVGVVEGTYRVFASTLGFADDPAKAVSIALLARISQIILATTSLSGLALWGGVSDIGAAARIAGTGGEAPAGDPIEGPAE